MAYNQDHQPSEYAEKIVQVSRVSKKTKGGNQIGFSVLVVVGDRKGKVGVALAKVRMCLSSIKKGVRKAKKISLMSHAWHHHSLSEFKKTWCC
jgi:small subunit ribosomal protein S5